MSMVATIFVIKMIEAALGGFIFATVLALTLLNFARIVDWFRCRSHIKFADKDNLAFSLCTHTSGGKYSTVYGIYNLRTDDIKDAESVTSQHLDAELAARHSREKLVVYE